MLSDADTKLGRVIDEAEYAVGLPRAALDELGCTDAEALRALTSARLERGDLRVRREVEQLARMIDVSRGLVHADVGHGAQALARAGFVGELLPVTFRLRVSNDGSVRPGEALEALTGARELPHRCVRVGLWSTRGQSRATPMQLATLRGAAAAAVAAAPAG